VCEVMNIEPLEEKYRAFGWEVARIDGHDMQQIVHVLEQAKTCSAAGKPLLVIAATVKGKGVSFMENVGKWHHGVPSESELAQAVAELDALEAKLKGAAA